MSIEHCSQNFKNCSQKISLFSYIHFFGLMVLMLLEPSTSLTPHYAVSPLLCCRILASFFATAPHALSLVSRRILCYLLAVSPWDGSLAICWMLAVSPWEDFLTIPWVLAVSPWGDSIAISCLLAVSPWRYCLCTSECWSYIALSRFRGFHTLPDNTICLFLLKAWEGSGGQSL